MPGHQEPVASHRPKPTIRNAMRSIAAHSSSSRVTAGAFGFLTLIQAVEVFGKEDAFAALGQKPFQGHTAGRPCVAAQILPSRAPSRSKAYRKAALEPLRATAARSASKS